KSYSYSVKSGKQTDTQMNFVYPEYFDALGIKLLNGRDYRIDDRLSSAKVCIVNDAFAKKYFGTVNALGHKIGMGIDPGTKTDITVIGVVRGTKYESMRDQVPVEVFRPYRQMEFGTGVTVYLRTRSNPEQIFNTIRKRVHDLDANLPVFEMIILEKQMENSLVTERLVTTLSTGFGLLATLL